MRKILIALFLAVLIPILSFGCGSHDGGMRGVSSDQADRMNAQRNAFDREEDPPFTVNTHYAAGQLAESQGSANKAVEQYKAALRIKSEHLPSLYRLGVIYAAAKHYPESIEMWERYIKASKGEASGYSNLGYTQEMAGNARAAEEAYRRGIAANPSYVPCHVNYGLFLARQGRTEEAEKELSTVLRPAEVRYNLGSVYEQQGQVERAREQYQAAIALDPDMKEAKARLTKLEK